MDRARRFRRIHSEQETTLSKGRFVWSLQKQMGDANAIHKMAVDNDADFSLHYGK